MEPHEIRERVLADHDRIRRRLDTLDLVAVLKTRE